ncbi:MAG: hydrolase 1, exosortase A system-associated [Motiliproteus sp.]
MFNEEAVVVEIQGGQLTGIVHQGDKRVKTGVLIVVGGPQYRVGSHRQFVHLARFLAAQGVPVMRFDNTGMGDSSGQKCSFDRLDTDLSAAIDSFMSTVATLEQVVLWGLCDGASAAMMYGHQDHRVRGLVLVNPWMENSQAKAHARVSQYYVKRFINIDFWKKLIKGEARILNSLQEFFCTLKGVFYPKKSASKETVASTQPYQQRMLHGLQSYSGKVLFVLSGNDLTAKEFNLQMAGDSHWAKVIESELVSFEHNTDADHTFSSREFKDWVAERTATFISTQK